MGGHNGVSDYDWLAARMAGFVAEHEAHIRAAVRLVTGPLLLRKVAGYVDSDGWVDWEWLARDLITGLPWSSGERQLARLACSLSGQMAYLDRGDRIGDVLPWTLAELLSGLDERNQSAALASIHYAVTGRPISDV